MWIIKLLIFLIGVYVVSMTDVKDFMRSKPCLRWVGTVICLLQHLKGGIEDIAYNRIKDLHDTLKLNISAHSLKQCDECTSENIQYHGGRYRVSCFAGVCNLWFDMLLEHHSNQQSPPIFIKNLKPHLWSTESWEIAKFYLPAGCKETTCAKDCDAASLLTLFKNLADIEDNELIQQVLDIRHKVMHTPDMCVDESQFLQYTRKILELLDSFTDLTELEKERVGTAAENIRKVQSEDINLTHEDEMYAVQERIRALQTSIDDLTARCTSIETGIVKNRDMKKHISDVQKDLKTFYERVHTRSRVLNDNYGIEYVFAEPDIKIVRETTNPAMGLEYVPEDATATPGPQFKRLFHTQDYTCRNIYLTGGEKCGKTTYCRYIMHVWCAAHTDRIPCSGDEKVVHQQDIDIMSNFQLLFYLKPEECKRMYTVADMIQDQILKRLPSHNDISATDLLKNAHCLVIIDSVEKWVCPENAEVPYFACPAIPGRDVTSNNTFFTTITSKFFDKIHSNNLELDKRVDLLGLNIVSSKKMCSNITSLVYRNRCIRRPDTDFWEWLENADLLHFYNEPVIIIHLLGIWLDDNTRFQSQVEMYGSILKMLLNTNLDNNGPTSTHDELNKAALTYLIQYADGYLKSEENSIVQVSEVLTRNQSLLEYLAALHIRKFETVGREISPIIRKEISHKGAFKFPRMPMFLSGLIPGLIIDTNKLETDPRSPKRKTLCGTHKGPQDEPLNKRPNKSI